VNNAGTKQGSNEINGILKRKPGDYAARLKYSVRLFVE
jgi:hypothetical protein